MVALAKASSSHARSRRSSPATEEEAVDPDDEKAKKDDVEAVPEELAVKEVDVDVEASQLLLDSVSETAAAAAARVRVSGPGDPASESATPSAGAGAAAAAGGGEGFFFLTFFLDADGFIAPVAVAAPSPSPFPYSPLRFGVARWGVFDLRFRSISAIFSVVGMGKMGAGRTKEKARGLRRSHADSREMGGGVVGPPETPHPMSCGAHDVGAPPVIDPHAPRV